MAERFDLSEVEHYMEKMSPDQANLFEKEYFRQKKDKTLAYVLWFVAALYYGYLGKWGMQILHWITFRGLMIWAVIDIFRIGKLVDEYNDNLAMMLYTEITGKAPEGIVAKPSKAKEPGQVPAMPARDERKAYKPERVTISDDITYGTILVASGKSSKKSFKISGSGLSIGRGTANDVVFNDDRVSTKHAWVIPLKGRIYCIDKDSHNGTYVNGENIRKSRLSDGDEIKIGKDTGIKLIYRKK